MAIFERYVPVPLHGGHIPKYSYRNLDVGESYIEWCSDDMKYKVHTNVLNAIRNFKKRVNRHYTTRKVKGGIQIWRTR